MTDTPVGTVTDWDDTTWDKFHKWLDDILRENVVEITFTKTDGSQRHMNCTKKYDVIESGIKSNRVTNESDITTVSKKKKAAPASKNLITVWDIDVNDWRSFRVKNLTNILTICIKYGPIK